MGVLLMACPHTGRQFSTGIQVDAATFNALPDVLVQSLCPYCGLRHCCWTREAKFADVIRPEQWVETRRPFEINRSP